MFQSEAIKAGQNSAEHLNGYKIWNQGKISLAEKNYAALTANSNLWNCPTLYNFSMEWSPDKAQSVLNNPEVKGMLPMGTIEIWQKRLKNIPKQAYESVNKNGADNISLVNEITLNLYKANAKLIAGTDASSIPFLVPGYALHEELRTFHEIGIPTYHVLKMTTCNAALSMNKEREFGTVEIGKRADLLLLNSNPLQNLNSLKDKSGMMIRGIWLSDGDLQKISDQIKTTFSN